MQLLGLISPTETVFKRHPWTDGRTLIFMAGISPSHAHHPQKVLLAQFSPYVHKGGLKPHFILFIFTHDYLCVLLIISWLRPCMADHGVINKVQLWLTIKC